MNYLDKKQFVELMPTNCYCKIKNFIDLFTCLLTVFKCDNIEPDNAGLAEKIMIYSLMWGICGTMDSDQRKRVSSE